MKIRIVLASALKQTSLLARDYFPKGPGVKRLPPIPLRTLRKLLEYNFREVLTYETLTPKERNILSPEQFTALRLWLFGDKETA